MSADDIATVTKAFGQFEVIAPQPLNKPSSLGSQNRGSGFSNRGRQAANKKAEPEKTFSAKLFKTHEFGYRRITIERPLRESYQFSDERINTLRFAPKPLNAAMQWLYETYGADWTDVEDCADYGVLADHEVEIRAKLKADFSELKEKQIKDLLDPKTWQAQKDILLTARALKAKIGSEQHDDMNGYEAALKATGLKLDAKEKKQITAAVSWKNPEAEKVLKKIHKGKADPFYGRFAVGNKVIEYKPDGDLRDNENVALDPSQSVNALNEAYFQKEVLPHVADAWIDASKTDALDSEIGIVGYEIPFNRHFYQYQPPRDLKEIDEDLDAVSSEIMKLLQEVHS
jgi:type I restriction enzyme M protein